MAKSTGKCRRCGSLYFVGEECLPCETCEGDVS
jgi:hypothetical protein